MFCSFSQVLETRANKGMVLADTSSAIALEAFGMNPAAFGAPARVDATTAALESSDTDAPSDSSGDDEDAASVRSAALDDAPAAAAMMVPDDDDDVIPIQVAIDSKKSNSMAGYCFCLTGM